MSGEFAAESIQAGDFAGELETWLSKITIPVVVINPQGRVLVSNPICIRNKNIHPGDRVILQDEPNSGKKFLFLPLDQNRFSGRIGVLSSIEISWKENPAQIVFLDHEPSSQLAALTEARRMLQTLVSNLPGMVYRCKLDSTWVMTYLAGQCYELTGYSPDDLINSRSHSYGGLILPEDRARIWDHLKHAVEENRPYQLTYRIQPKTGPAKWVWEQGRVVFTQDGKKTALEGLIIDITDRQSGAEALLESEERYRSLLEVSSDAVAFVDARGKVIVCNKHLCELIGESEPRGQVGRLALRFLDLEQRRVILKAIVKAQSEHTPIPEFMTTIHFCGKQSPVRVNIVATHGSSQAVKGYLIVVQDLSTIEGDRRELRERDAVYRAIVEDSPKLIVRFTSELVITFANETFCQYYGLSREELAGKNLGDLLLPTSMAVFDELKEKLIPQMPPIRREYFDKTSHSTPHWIEWSTRAIVDSENHFIEYQSIGEDITGKKVIEQSVKDSEYRFRELLGNVKLAAIILDLQGNITFCNNYFCEVVGMRAEEVIGRNWLEKFLPIDDSITFKKLLLECALTGNIPTKRENMILTAQGEQRQIAWTNTTLKDNFGNVTGIASIGQDITERTFTERIQTAIFQVSQSANQAQDLDQLYFSIHQILQELMPVDNFFIALLDTEQNLLSFPYFVDQLDEQPAPKKPGRGLTEYVLRTGKTVLVNPEVFNLLVEEHEVESIGSPSVDWLGVPLKVENRVIGVMGAQSYSEGIRFKYRDEQMMSFVSTQVAMAIDRKRSEQALRKSQKRNELLVEASTDAIFVETLDGRILDCNSVASKMYGYSHEELCGLTVKDLLPPGKVILMPDYSGVDVESRAMISETENIRADGSVFPIEVSMRLTTIEGEQVVVAYVRDITERKRVERAIIDSEAKFRDLAETTAAGIFIHRGENYLYVNPAWCRMTGFSTEELKQMHVSDRLPEDQSLELKERNLIHLHGVQDVDKYEHRFETKEGQWRWFDVNSGLINYEGALAIIGTAVDVTARKQREHEMEVIVQISEILRTTTTMAEIPPTILKKLPDLLDVEGALLCTYDKRDGNLLRFFGAGSWKVLEGITLPRGKGLASHIMDSGKLYVNHVPMDDPYFAFPELVQSMKSMAGAPLIAQGKINGVLIVGSEHHMGDFELRLLTAVADITANGLQRAQLYDQTLEQTQELLNAYNATLEGWTLALELRDKEIQGHSHRVAERTLRLARRMGFDESQIENLRQGALLHDIGKMGIPDTILLKPGTLTEAEWTIMRKHPEYARDMLSQIPFFKGSIDIPYCHHEWWDGTGYPQGLEGKQIPFSARIFAIVDAWDALISNRPYRRAWDKKEALAHIINQAGTHFDPEVVDAFVKMLQEEGED